MRHATFTRSLLGVVGLMVFVGCGDLKSVLEDFRDGKAGPTQPTGTAGATGSSTSCTSVPDPSGGECKQCVDATGRIVSRQCSGGGSGGMSGGAPMSCRSFEQGGATSCKDVGTWKSYAYDDCARQMLVLTDYKPQTSCGEGGYQSVTYTCCTPTPPPPPLKCGETTDASGRICKTCWDQYGMVVSSDCGSSGTGGSTGGTCTRIVDGGPSSCKDIGTWKTYGAQRCADQNLTLSDVQPLTMCQGGIESVAYVCCGPVMPPVVVRCEPTMGPKGETCKTCYDANGRIVSNECAGGSPGAQCFKLQDGGPTSCKDEGTWKMYGIQRCAEQKATLTELTALTTCAGGISSVAYVCCPSAPTPVDPSPAKCEATMGANGQLCKTCWDATGRIVATDCSGGSTSSCKTWTNDAGATCTECVDNGTIVSSACRSPEPPPVGMCALETAADGTACKVCYYADGLKTSSCPTPAEPK